MQVFFHSSLYTGLCVQVHRMDQQRPAQSKAMMFVHWLQDVFMEKYRSLEELLQKCYREEPLSPSSSEMKAILDSVGVLD